MADDLLHPDDRPDPAARFRADLAGYLSGLSGPELADLLDGLPDPVTVDLIAEPLRVARPALGCPILGMVTPTPSSCGGGRCGRWSPTGAPPAPSAAPGTRRAPPWLTGHTTAPPSADPSGIRRLSDGSARRCTVALPSAASGMTGWRWL
jgi:hypothetical protein